MAKLKGMIHVYIKFSVSLLMIDFGNVLYFQRKQKDGDYERKRKRKDL